MDQATKNLMEWQTGRSLPVMTPEEVRAELERFDTELGSDVAIKASVLARLLESASGLDLECVGNPDILHVGAAYLRGLPPAALPATKLRLAALKATATGMDRNPFVARQLAAGSSQPLLANQQVALERKLLNSSARPFCFRRSRTPATRTPLLFGFGPNGCESR